MKRISYVNGNFIPHNKASVHIEDRGFQFSDGVYEVLLVYNSKVFNFHLHYKRLTRSLKSISIKNPFKKQSLKSLIRKMIKVNKLDQGFVYLQITRGVKEREHHYSDVKLKPTIILTAKKIDLNKIKKTQSLGVKVTIFDDLRWKRCDIKSISLLPNVMAKNYAYKKSFYESLLVDESGNISEGSSTNAWMVNKNNVVITRKANNQILNGITRQVVMSVLKRNKFKVMEKSFSVKDAKKSKEFFITGTTTFVMPVVKIDKVTIGNGKPGTVTKQISKFFMERLK